MPEVTNGINNAVSCNTVAVQFSASLLRHCLPHFDEICGMTMNLVFFVQTTLIKIANASIDWSAALVLSLIN